MPLHPQCKAFLDTLASFGGPPMWELPIAEARKGPGLAGFGGPVEAVAHVADRTVPGPAGPIPIRVYRPSSEPRLPALMFFHGGGFVIGNLDSQDRQCRSLANASLCVVISVDYRLAPENPYPAAVDDAYAATRYVAEHAGEFDIDASRLAVGGESAGGNLAAVVALLARERGGPALRCQLLVYPVTDYTDDSPSMHEFDGVFLSLKMQAWFADCYVPNAADRRAPYASPLHARDLSGLPPALVITAECDMVRDQAEAYARALEAAGVPVTLMRYDGMIHPFFALAGVIDTARVAIADAGAALRNALAVQAT
jgi:acetyl esterase